MFRIRKENKTNNHINHFIFELFVTAMQLHTIATKAAKIQYSQTIDRSTALLIQAGLAGEAKGYQRFLCQNYTFWHRATCDFFTPLTQIVVSTYLTIKYTPWAVTHCHCLGIKSNKSLSDKGRRWAEGFQQGLGSYSCFHLFHLGCNVCSHAVQWHIRPFIHNRCVVSTELQMLEAKGWRRAETIRDFFFFPPMFYQAWMLHINQQPLQWRRLHLSC